MLPLCLTRTSSGLARLGRQSSTRSMAASSSASPTASALFLLQLARLPSQGMVFIYQCACSLVFLH